MLKVYEHDRPITRSSVVKLLLALLQMYAVQSSCTRLRLSSAQTRSWHPTLI